MKMNRYWVNYKKNIRNVQTYEHLSMSMQSNKANSGKIDELNFTKCALCTFNLI